MPSKENAFKGSQNPFAKKIIIILIFKFELYVDKIISYILHIKIIPAISFKIMVVLHTVFQEIYSTFSFVIDNNKKNILAVAVAMARKCGQTSGFTLVM